MLFIKGDPGEAALPRLKKLLLRKDSKINTKD